MNAIASDLSIPLPPAPGDERFVIEYTPRHAVRAAARINGWQAWGDRPASAFVDPHQFKSVRILPTLPEAIAFGQELCARGGDYFDRVQIEREVYKIRGLGRQAERYWLAVRLWQVTKNGPEDPLGVAVVAP